MSDSRKSKQCFVCGITYTDRQYGFWNMTEVKDIYLVSEHKDLCNKCGSKANSFLNYWGVKKQVDKEMLRKFLVSGVLPMLKYNAQMNAGYYPLTIGEV
jgi:hypothetical protein